MKTHTIRKIKSSGNITHCIVTFTKQYMDILKESHPDSVTLIINHMCYILKDMTGKEHKINWEQYQELEKHFGNLNRYASKSYNELQVKNIFINGFNCKSMIELEKDLEVLNYFFNNIIRSNKNETM
jgi:hypothetical protein